MIKIGMMIGARYEILEKIGTGGMSDVYKAKDHKLNRPVAVKVLKQEFSENANFVSKFRIEAQAAAGLMHPNIVNVYDVGDENDIYYIVMELVEGITLKKYIEKKARISVREAVTIAIQICMGIEVAHNNHIIHRDIKPQNVIISKEGKVKVTDFGIAKAATSNTITSNVMGSVHYTSPEQARGGFSDEKSDIYSLGITLFEMLTGRVPFNGDTTVAIAIKQIQEEMPSPRDFVPEIPVSVEQIVLKCTQKAPDKRYQSMEALIADLKKSLTAPDENFVKIVTDDDLGATRTISQGEKAVISKAKPASSEITGELPEAEPSSENEEDDEYSPKMEKITTIIAIVIGIAICVLIIFIFGKLLGAFGPKKPASSSSVSDTSISASVEVSVEQVTMPKVVDMTFDKASDTLKKYGLVAKAKYVESDTVEKDIVISCSVHDGTKVNVGTEIELTVSAGQKTEEVPDVVGKTLSAANKDIMNRNFKVDIVEEYDDFVAEGHVISQNPEGLTAAPVGATITIVVSKGSKTETFEMPSVLGKTMEEAVLILTENGLTVGTTEEVYNNVYGEGYVCYQSVSYGTDVTKGMVVDIQVSKGPEPASIPRYSFKANILAPTVTEDEEYISGTEVHIVIETNDGTQLFETNTTSFPVSVSLDSFTGSSTGTIKMTYTVIRTLTSIDPETGEEVTGEEEVDKEIIREVEFTQIN